MKNSTWFYLILTICLVITGCEKDVFNTLDIECNHEYLNVNHPKADDYQNLIDDYVAKGFPGISLYVEDSKGVWVGSSGFADLQNDILFQPCHVSKAASITKLMVGALAMKLQEEGFFNIDDPIDQYLDEALLDKIKFSGGKTIRNLLNHTTGVADLIKSSAFYLDVLNYPNKHWQAEELLQYIYGVEPTELTEETPARYSNTNTLLLSMVIKEATGKDHHVLLREKILDPLGMNDTYYQSREKLPEITAQGYFDLHNSGELLNVSNFITGSGNGYGGMFSNVFDLKKFLSALMIDKTLVTPASLDEMLSEFNRARVDPEPEVGDVEAGIGFLRKFSNLPEKGLGHSGKDLGYTADMFYFPETGMTMIFFINYGTDSDSHLRDDFFRFEYDLMSLMFGN